MRTSLLRYTLSLWAISITILLSSCRSANKTAEYNNHNKTVNSKTANKESNELKAKYALKLGVDENKITNVNLYSFIDSWYGTPYKYAGKSRSGIDCSGFVALLEQYIYNINVSGSCSDIYNSCKPIKPSQLKEGDLVFFKVNSKTLSHVGVYLQNNKFVHASVHSGVVISNLEDAYYKKYFFVAARLTR